VSLADAPLFPRDNSQLSSRDHPPLAFFPRERSSSSLPSVPRDFSFSRPLSHIPRRLRPSNCILSPSRPYGKLCNRSLRFPSICDCLLPPHAPRIFLIHTSCSILAITFFLAYPSLIYQFPRPPFLPPYLHPFPRSR